MPKITRDVLRQVQDALEQYEEEVEASSMTRSTKDTYLRHAWHFVRWLDDDFVPGATLRSDARER